MQCALARRGAAAELSGSGCGLGTGRRCVVGGQRLVLVSSWQLATSPPLSCFIMRCQRAARAPTPGIPLMCRATVLSRPLLFRIALISAWRPQGPQASGPYGLVRLHYNRGVVKVLHE